MNFLEILKLIDLKVLVLIWMHEHQYNNFGIDAVFLPLASKHVNLFKIGSSVVFILKGPLEISLRMNRHHIIFLSKGQSQFTRSPHAFQVMEGSTKLFIGIRKQTFSNARLLGLY